MIVKKLADQEVVQNPAQDRTWEETLGANELCVIPKGNHHKLALQADCRGVKGHQRCARTR